MNRKYRNIMVKSNSKFICQECGSTEMLQAHHKIPKDDSSLICLCAICHSKKHPELPFKLFIGSNKQPYWNNKSASSLARELNVHPRTICRSAKRLNIGTGYLTEENERAIRDNINYRNNYESILYIRVSDEIYNDLCKEKDRRCMNLSKYVNRVLSYHVEIMNDIDKTIGGKNG